MDGICPNWEGIVLQKSDEYVAVLPLPVKKKYGISFLQQPLFAQQLGVFSVQKLSISEIEDFFALLQKKFRLVSDYPFNILNYQEYKISFEKIFGEKSLKRHMTHHLPLQGNYEKIRQGYKKDTKYRINQAKRENFEIIKSTNIDLLYDFFEKSVVLENGISSEARPILKKVFNILKKRNLAELYYIKNQEKEIVSGILFVKSQSLHSTKWIYLFNAANPSMKERNESRRWFLDKFIQEKNNEVNKNNFDIQSNDVSFFPSIVLDFESAQELEVARFYASFGSEAQSFFVLNYNRLSFYIRHIQKIIQFIKSKLL